MKYNIFIILGIILFLLWNTINGFSIGVQNQYYVHLYPSGNDETITEDGTPGEGEHTGDVNVDHYVDGDVDVEEDDPDEQSEELEQPSIYFRVIANNEQDAINFARFYVKMNPDCDRYRVGANPSNRIEPEIITHLIGQAQSDNLNSYLPDYIDEYQTNPGGGASGGGASGGASGGGASGDSNLPTAPAILALTEVPGVTLSQPIITRLLELLTRIRTTCNKNRLSIINDEDLQFLAMYINYYQHQFPRLADLIRREFHRRFSHCAVSSPVAKKQRN